MAPIWRPIYFIINSENDEKMFIEATKFYIKNLYWNRINT